MNAEKKTLWKYLEKPLLEILEKSRKKNLWRKYKRNFWSDPAFMEQVMEKFLGSFLWNSWINSGRNPLTNLDEKESLEQSRNKYFEKTWGEFYE